MNLVNQFQGLFGSLFLGFFFMWFYHLYSKVFTSKLILINAIFNLFLFLGYTVIYLMFLFDRTYGIYNIFYIPSLFVGVLLYEKFYSVYFEPIFMNIQKVLRKLICSLKIRFKRKNKKKRI